MPRARRLSIILREVRPDAPVMTNFIAEPSSALVLDFADRCLR
jgi:hypothetical protein